MSKTKLKTLLVSALILVAILAFSACGNGGADAPDTALPEAGDATSDATTPTTPEDPAQPQVPTEPPAGGRVTHVSMSESPFMDPIRQNDSATADLTFQIFEGLVMFLPYPYNEIVPALATSWSQVNDTTWEFNLREGVYFHDGSYFNAYAWKWSIDRLLDPREAAPGAFILEMVEEVRVIDDYTVHLINQFPFTPILGHLTHQVAYAVSPAAMANEVRQRLIDFEPYDITDDDDNVIETVAEYVLSPWQEAVLAYADGRGLAPAPTMVTQNPIGTGPYRFVRRVSGDYTLLVPNENHWRPAPQVGELVFRVIPEPATRFAMLQTGEANSIELTPGDVMQLPLHPHIEHYIIAGTGIDHIGFNVGQDGPLSDVRVRQALTYGLNVESVILGAYEGIGIPAVGPIGPNVLYSPHYEFERRPFDPNRARELLAEAGYADGLTLDFWVNAGNPMRLATAEIAQAYWSQLGVNINIDTLEWGVYLDTLSVGDHDLYMLGWTTVTGDPDYGTISLFHTDFHGDPGNRAFYSNPVVDRLLEEGRMSTDSNRRRAIYREITEILIEDAPWIFIRHPIMNWGSNGIDGFAIDFNNRPNFHNVTISN